MKLNVLAMALTCALLWGLGVAGCTWWIILFDGPSSDPTFLGKIYRGYRIDGMGALIGLAWALPDGFIGGAVLAALYNWLSGKLGPSDRS